MDPMEFRTLLARGEHRHLDYKEQHIERVKLVRAIMAIANSLSRGQVGHVLIGVREGDDRTGVPVGVEPDRHPDDADVHDWVAGYLNRVPEFSYSIHQDEGRSFGVVRVLGDGRRPFFPLKDQGSNGKGNPILRRYVGFYREGSRTEVVPPNVYVEWHKEDHGLDERLAELTLAQQEANRRPLVDISYEHHHHWDDQQAQNQRPTPPYVRLTLNLRNVGTCALRIVSLSLVWRLHSNPARSSNQTLPPISEARIQQVLTPGSIPQFYVDLTREGAHSLATPSSYPALSDLELVPTVMMVSVPFGIKESETLPAVRVPG